MKITIDTKEDSHEDIQKVLHILTNIIQNKESSTTQHNFPEPQPDTTNLMSMFANPEPQKEVPNTPPDFGAFLNLANKEEEKKEDSGIELF